MQITQFQLYFSSRSLPLRIISRQHWTFSHPRQLGSESANNKERETGDKKERNAQEELFTGNKICFSLDRCAARIASYSDEGGGGRGK